jgi:hypothetical protein
MIPKKTRDQYTIAIHEAGHALVALIYGVPFDKISLIADGGEVQFNGRYAEFPANAQIHMAGTIAELIHEKKIGTFLENGGVLIGGTDGEHLRDAMKKNIEDDDEAIPLFSWLFVRTAKQLMRRWPYVLKLANELIKKGTLSYKECLAMIPPKK